MRVTHKEMDRAWSVVTASKEDYVSRQTLRAALEAALADVPEQVPGPFVLSDDEAKELAQVRPFASCKHVATALDRAVRTLGAPAVKPLSEQLRKDAEFWSNDPVRTISSIAKELLRRCPKPAPVQRTPEELHAQVLSGCSLEIKRAAIEWLARAKKAPK